MRTCFFKTMALLLNLALIMCICSVCGVSATTNAIPISSKADLNNIRNDLSGSYYLTCDITFAASDFSSSGAYYNSGKGFVPIGDGKTPFTGTFDGRGYTISGLKSSVSGSVYTMKTTAVNTGISLLADDEWTGDYIINPTPKPTLNVSPAVGLFGANEGTIKNLTVSDSSFTARSSNSATLYIGGIAGHNNGNIENCAVKNTLNGDAHSHIGGIVGYQSGGTVSNCFVRGNVESEGVFGGIIATVAGGSVINSYSEPTFTGNAAACFGVVGLDVLESINNCYYISDSDIDGYGERISTLAAKDPKAYEGFDFDTYWYMSGTLRRPAVKGVLLPEGEDVTTGDLNGDKTVDLKDVVLLAKYVAEWDIDVYNSVANVDFDFSENGDDVINLNDVIYLAQYNAKWDGVILY